MGEALKKWGMEGWTTPIYHPRANPVERQNQELKKGLRTLLVDKPHHLWDFYLPHVLFSVRNKENRNTGLSPAKLMFGREIKATGDWQLELAEGSPDVGKNDLELGGADRNPSGEIEDSPVEPDDAPVIKDAYPVSSSSKAPSTHNTPEVPGKDNLSVGDWVYYKAHPQSSADCGEEIPRGVRPEMVRTG
ncbi:Integrase catalytic domain-containing protein [Aphis craccivora]|uniref:Integrase catalytic domain-containing protein n=1 Tax=Aphis craccivora TaxID=307492 RepID=A0A6G0X849_APHCR|nr:Integrase catalytic domain-containing protein [Aphis craccivora]